jgi:hypothetical protein
MSDLDDRRGAIADYALFAIQLAAACVPDAAIPAALLGGTATLGLARVREMRLQDFAATFRERFHAVDRRFDEHVAEDRFELLEAAAEAAARSASTERRKYLGELAARGLTTDELTADESRKLLNTLNAVTDSEVIVLMYLSFTTTPGKRDEARALRARHGAILDASLGREVGASPHEIRRTALYDGYVTNLQRLGLVHDTGAGGANKPTGLGQMLLGSIGAEASS